MRRLVIATVALGSLTVSGLAEAQGIGARLAEDGATTRAPASTSSVRRTARTNSSGTRSSLTPAQGDELLFRHNQEQGNLQRQQMLPR